MTVGIVMTVPTKFRLRSFDVLNRHNYADRYNPIAHVI